MNERTDGSFSLEKNNKNKKEKIKKDPVQSRCQQKVQYNYGFFK